MEKGDYVDVLCWVVQVYLLGVDEVWLVGLVECFEGLVVVLGEMVVDVVVVIVDCCC